MQPSHPGHGLPSSSGRLPAERSTVRLYRHESCPSVAGFPPEVKIQSTGETHDLFSLYLFVPFQPRLLFHFGYSSRAEDSASAIKSRLIIINTKGTEAPVTAAPIRSGAIKRIIKALRNIVMFSYLY